MTLRYWDADAFLGWLRAEPDKEEGCRAVIAEAQAGKLKIVTSTLTLAEVLWLKGNVGQLDTFDRALQRKSGQVGTPPLKIGPPGIEGQLFTRPVSDE